VDTSVSTKLNEILQVVKAKSDMKAEKKRRMCGICREPGHTRVRYIACTLTNVIL
jgi:hypothetical protein